MGVFRLTGEVKTAMKSQLHSHRIRISSSPSASGLAWNVFVEDENTAVFAGENGKGRALEYALRHAETLRTTGGVLLLVDNGADSTTRVVRSKLAS